MTIAYITTNGDPSVGIEGNFTEVDLNYDLDDENREEVRKMLTAFFSELWSDKARIQFVETEKTNETT